MEVGEREVGGLRWVEGSVDSLTTLCVESAGVGGDNSAVLSVAGYLREDNTSSPGGSSRNREAHRRCEAVQTTINVGIIEIII